MFDSDKRQAARFLPTAEQLATEFACVLLNDLGPEMMSHVIQRNASELYAGSVCASHDFLDANMSMFKACNGFDPSSSPEEIAHGDEWTRLWSEAWLIAKERRFADVLAGNY